MARGDHIWITVNDKTYSLRAWALLNDQNPFTLLRRWKRGVKDPYELLRVRPYYKPEMSMKTPEELTTKEVAMLKQIAWASEGQSDHWDIMCDLAGINRKYRDELKEVLND